MVEQLPFSASLPELTITDCSPPIKEAVAELEAILGHVSVYELENYVVVAVTLPVDIPTRGPIRNVDIREREPIAFLFLKTRYPHEAPLVWSDRLNFPIERLPHQSPLASGLPSQLCLHRGSLNDWFAEHSLRELVERVQGWLRDAASGRLIRPEDDFEPTLILPEQEAGFAVYAPEQMAEIVEQRWERRNNRKGSTHLACQAVDASDRTLSVRVGTTPLHRRAVEQVHDRARSQPTGVGIAPLAILVWPHHGKVTSEHFGRMLPATFGSLVEFAKHLGLSLEGIIDRHIRWYPKPARLPLILAIPRPQQLIGLSTSIEFLNFALPITSKWLAPNGRPKPDTPVWTLSNRLPISTDMAKRLSRVGTNTDGGILLAGCGALGSKIGLHLARAGLTELTLVDNDTVSPHNMIRHGMLSSSVGKNKAMALAQEIRQIFQDETSPLNVKVLPLNVLDVLFREQQALKESDWILDCTTSPVVLDALIDPRLPQLPRVMRSVIAHNGALGFLLVEGADRKPRVDDLQACIYDLAIDDNAIAAWLQAHQRLTGEAGSALEEITIGLGCSSPTMRMADDVVSYHASAASMTVKRVISDHSFAGVQISRWGAEEGYIGRVDQVVVNPFHELFPPGDGGWTVRIRDTVLRELMEQMEQTLPDETGGLLVGHTHHKRRVIYVTRALPPPPDSVGWPYAFRLGVKDVPEELAQIAERTGGLIRYAGEWHSHTDDSHQLSARDIGSASQLTLNLRRAGLPTHIMIVTKAGCFPHIVENQIHAEGGG